MAIVNKNSEPINVMTETRTYFDLGVPFMHSKAVCNLRDETGETYLKPACGSRDRTDHIGVYFEKIFSS